MKNGLLVHVIFPGHSAPCHWKKKELVVVPFDAESKWCLHPDAEPSSYVTSAATDCGESIISLDSDDPKRFPRWNLSRVEQSDSAKVNVQHFLPTGIADRWDSRESEKLWNNLR